MWGKFGQQTNKTQVKEFTDTPEFWRFLGSSKHDIRWVSPLDEDRVEVHHKMTPFWETDSPHLNIFIAAFTTCHARVRLYGALDHLQDRCLYSDTDSVVSSWTFHLFWRPSLVLILFFRVFEVNSFQNPQPLKASLPSIFLVSSSVDVSQFKVQDVLSFLD